MAASRPFWKGFLRLSFVLCPIALYPAVSAAERISFRQVNKRTGHRLRHQLVDSVTGETVEATDKGRGYEIGADQFLMVSDRDIDQARQTRAAPEPQAVVETLDTARFSRAPLRVAAPPSVPAQEEVLEVKEDLPSPPRPQNTHTIEIERFLPAGRIDARYYEKPYYVVPREPVGQEPFAVIRDAMRSKKMVGLGRVILSSRERPILLEPMGNGLRAITLRFAHEIRSEADYFDEIPEMILPRETMKLAEHIIDTKSGDFDPAMLEDHYSATLVHILRKKQAKMPAAAGPVTPSRENVVDLMEALKRSIAVAPPIPKSLLRRAAAPKPMRAKRAHPRTRKAG